MSNEWDPQLFAESIVISGTPKGIQQFNTWIGKCDALVVTGVTGVLNLTNTTKYYSPEWVSNREGQTTEYLSVPIPHAKPPTLKQWLTCIEFLDRHRGRVVVHCTHGVHRTGAVVCAYACVRMNMTPNQAIDSFQALRDSYGMLKDRKHLYRFVFKQYTHHLKSLEDKTKRFPERNQWNLYSPSSSTRSSKC